MISEETWSDSTPQSVPLQRGLKLSGEAQHTSFTPGAIANLVPALIGRDSELQQLLELLYTVIEAGNTQLVTMTGMAGVGKSRLAFELRSWVARLPEAPQFFIVQAEPQVGLRPYSLIRGIVMRYFRISESDSPARMQLRLEQGISRLLGDRSHEKAHFIGYLLGFDFAQSPHVRGVIHDLRQIRDRAMYYMLQCVAALAVRSPMVLLIDDLHHADDSSLDVLEYLARAGHDVPLLLCCLTRDQLYDRRRHWARDIERATRIMLQPLDERDSRRLVGEILRKAGKLTPELRALITSRAEGNPLYVEELIKMLIADEVIIPGPDHWQVRPARLSRLRVPSSLHDLLQARIQALSASERDFIERASVVGRTFWIGSTLQLGSLDQAAVGERSTSVTLQTTLAWLVQKELIVRQTISRFSNEEEYIFRHTLLHEVAYERVAPKLRRSYHAQVATWLTERDSAEVDSYAGLIAEHYERAAANDQATIWYTRAAHRASGAFALEEAIGFYRKAMSFQPADIEHAAGRITLYAGLGDLYHAMARLADAALSFNNMRELAEAIGDRTAQARAWNDLARIYDSTVQHRAALECAQRAVELARETDDRHTLAQALLRWGWQLVRLDESAAALELGEQAQAIFAELDDSFNAARAVAMLGVVHELLGNYDEANRCLTQSLAIHRERSDLLEVSIDLNNLGVLANAQGDWFRAIAVLEEDLRLVRDIGNRVGEIYTLSNLGIARVGLGDYAQAEADIRQGIQICQLNRIPIFSDFYRSLAEVCLATGRIDEALEAAQRSVDLAVKAENKRELGAAWRAQGMTMSRLDNPMGAPPCFVESTRLFAEAGAANERARTLREWSRHERENGDPQRAIELWQEAQAIFTHLGLHWELSIKH